MKENLKKVLALLTVFTLLFAFAACKKEPADANPSDDAALSDNGSTAEQTAAGYTVTENFVVDGTTLPGQTTTMPFTVAPVTSDPASLLSDPATTVEGETTTAAKAGLDSTDAAAVVDFYKAAAAKTGKINGANQTMTLKSLEGGSGAIGKLIDLFTPIAKNALEKNSTAVDNVPGTYASLTAADVTSAKATSDGKYTTVNIKLKEQTDPAKADSKAGPVGHGIGTLGDVDNAINELKGVSVDYSNGTLSLKYNDAYITAKIDNATGKIVSATWHYVVNVTIDNVKVKITIISATLKGATGQVEYKVVY